MKKLVSFILAAGILAGAQNVFADSRIGLCTDLGTVEINTEKTLNAVKKADADWIRFTTAAWRDCLQSDGSFVYPEREKEVLKKISDQGIKKISILGMGTPTNTYFRTQEDKNKGIYAMWYDLPVRIEGDSYAMEYWNANLEAVENTVRAQLGLIDAYEVWNEPNHWAFNGYTKKCTSCGTEYEGYNMPSKCSCGGALDGIAITTAEEYADIYIAWREIVDRVYEEAGLEPVPVYCGSVTGWEKKDEAYFNDCIDAIIEHDGDLSNLDGITLHLYGKAGSDWGTNAFPDYKKKLKSSGFYGEIFMTETGLYTSSYTDTEQAMDLIPRTVAFETFLKNMKSSGLATEGKMLYYEFQDGGNNPEDPEHNFGLVDFMYDNKEGFETLTVLNKVLKGKELVSFSHEDETDILSTSGAKEVRVAKYEGNGDCAYLVFRYDDSSIFDLNTSTTINVSGDELRVYNYTGDLKEEITKKPSGNKTLTGIKANKPVIVECVTYKSVIEWAEYDAENNILSFEGNFWNEDSFDETTATAEIVNKNGEVVKSTTLSVKNDRFSDWMSLMLPEGEYILRVGSPELSSGVDEVSFKISAQEEETKTQPTIAGVTVVYDKDTDTVKLSGTVENPTENQKITIMAVPADAELNNLNADAIGCIKEIEVSAENTFSDEIKIPEWYNGASKLYVSGTNIKDVNSADFDKQESEFAYLAEFSGTDGDVVTTKAVLRNFTSKEQKALMLVCEYGNGGKLINSHTKPIEIAAKTYSQTPFEINDIVPDKDTTQIRAYLWSDAGTLKPLTEAINIRN